MTTPQAPHDLLTLPFPFFMMSSHHCHGKDEVPVDCPESLMMPVLIAWNQGDLLRKSMERFVGTAVGSLLAMAVLVVDDSIVPEAKGWYAREEFYLTMIGTVTMVWWPRGRGVHSLLLAAMSRESRG